MLEKLDPFQLLVVGAIGTAIGMFLRPLAERLVELIFVRKPAFAFKPAVIRNSWVLDVEPLNSTAEKRRPLSVRFDGSNIRDIGKLKDKRTISWRVDLSEIEGLPKHLKTNGSAEIQFFFSPDRTSEKMKIGFESGTILSKGRAAFEIDTIADFISSIKSDRRVVVKNSKINVTDGSKLSSDSIRWESVWDGKELHIENLSNIEFIGVDAALIAEPRYAWVLHFQHCNNITIRNLAVGHLNLGSCQGGVIKFDKCSGIRIENCDLYGSGTYGLEFDNCDEIEVLSTQIHDCTYGILQMRDCSNALFSNCHFHKNKEFDLCTFAGKIDVVSFRNCTFVQNSSRSFLFCLKEANESGLGVEVWQSTFDSNSCRQFVDDPRKFFEKDNRHTGNQWSQP
jgi:hypothetical protein